MKKLTQALTFGLILILNECSFGQGIYDYPDSLFNAGDYTNARIAYKKKIFDLTNSRDDKADLLDVYYLKLSDLNFVQSRYSEAYDCLKKITTEIFEDEHDIMYKKAFYAYLASDFATCEYEIELERIENSSSIDVRLSILEVLALNEMGRWEQAQTICKTDLYKAWGWNSAMIGESSNLYANVPKMKSVKKAEFLNFIIPGAGYFYLGKNRDGFISSSLQVASLGLTAILALQKLYLSGFFIGFGLYGKFKTGSTRRAMDMAKEINAQRRYDFNIRVRDFLLK
jgi:tetratricopeptide (TPR) repeat protein